MVRGDSAQALAGCPDPDALSGVVQLQALTLRAMAATRAPTAESGIDDARRAVELAEALGAQVAAAQCALGWALFSEGQSSEGEPLLLSAFEQAESAGDPTTAGRALSGLAVLRVRQHCLEEAAELMHRASVRLQAGGVLHEAGVRWLGLGNLRVWSGDLEAAEEAFLRATACAGDRHPALAADTLRSRAKVRRAHSDVAAARAMLLEARQVVPDHAQTVRARIANDLGDVAMEAGQLDEARTYLRESLSLRERAHQGIGRVNLAQVEHRAGRPEAAMAILAPLLRSKNEPPWVVTFANAVAVATVRSPDRLDGHLRVLEDALAEQTLTERNLLELLEEAAQNWAGRDPSAAARLWALVFDQAVALKLPTAPMAGALVDARMGGAGVPLGALSLQREVGRGGMGQVWLATVVGTDVEVAVKVLPPDRAADEATRAALGRELRAVAALDHPGIVPLVDHGIVPAAVNAMTAGRLAQGTPWFATRWAQGGSLAHMGGRQSWIDVRSTLLQLLEALGAAHAAGLVHLDVKPSNVLVARDTSEGEAPVVWLADFGVARAMAHRSDQPVAGTPAFMAPEQCQRNLRAYGPWTDLYALGGLAVTLVAGRPPFSGTTAELLQQQVARQLPALRSGISVPQGFEAWCARLLAKSPTDRYRSAAAAAAVLRELPDPPEGLDPQRPLALISPTSSSSTFVLETVPMFLNPPGGVGVVHPALPLPASPPTDRIRPPPSIELAAAATRQLPLRPLPVVGQQAARDGLWAALHATQTRGVQVARLRGPAAAGASHLADWLCRSALRTGAVGAAWVNTGDADPWAAGLARILRADGMDMEALEAALPSLLALHVGQSTLGQTERGLLARALMGLGDPVPMWLRVVQDWCAAHPVVVAVDVPDDGCASDLVGRLVHRLAALPVLVVCTHPVATELPPERVHDIVLQPLSTRDLQTLTEQLLPLAPRVARAAVKAVAGDPSHLVWMTRGWLASRALTPGPLGLQQRYPEDPLAESAEAALRQLVDSVVASRPGHRRRIELAAAFGRTVPRAGWLETCVADGVGVDPELAEILAGRGLWRAVATGWTFADARLCEVILGRLTVADRQARHGVLASVVIGDAERGHHLHQSGAHTEALAALDDALLAEWGSRPHRWRAVASMWREVVGSAMVDPACSEALIGEALLAVEERTASMTELEDLCARASEVPDAQALAWLAIGGEHQRAGDAAAAGQAYGRALSTECSLRIVGRAHWQRGTLALDTHDHQLAVEHFEQAIASGELEAREYAVAAWLRSGDLQTAAAHASATRPAAERGTAWAAVRRLVLSAAVAEAQGHGEVGRQGLAEVLRLAPTLEGADELVAHAQALQQADGDPERAAQHLAALVAAAERPPWMVTPRG